MSEKNENKTEKTAGRSPAQESVYTIAELADSAKALGAPREVVIAALRLAGGGSYSFHNAKRIVETFSNKEV